MIEDATKREHKQNIYAQEHSEPEFAQRQPSFTNNAHALAIAGGNETLHLLRELASAHKELALERQQHLQDLRLLLDLQSSIKLLENNTQQTSLLKTELLEAQKDLIDLKNKYQQLLNRPWWKRLFRHAKSSQQSDSTKIAARHK